MEKYVVLKHKIGYWVGYELNVKTELDICNHCKLILNSVYFIITCAKGYAEGYILRST